MKKFPLEKPKGTPSPEEPSENTIATNESSTAEVIPVEPNASVLDIASLTLRPSSRYAIKFSNTPLASQTAQSHTHLPPLLSWKDALLPIHHPVKQIDLSHRGDEVVLSKEQPNLQQGRSTVTEDPEARHPFRDFPPRRLIEETKGQPHSPLSPPPSGARDFRSLSSYGSNSLDAATTLSSESPGIWRPSIPPKSRTTSKKLSTSSARKAAIPFDSNSMGSWRRSETEAEIKASPPVLRNQNELASPSPKQQSLTKQQDAKSEPHPVLADIPDELNCAVFITNFSVDVTPSEIFDYIHAGAVQALHIYPPNRDHTTKAAKLVFAKAESAEMLILEAKGPFHVYMGDVRLHVTYNRDGSLAQNGPETRVLMIEGPEELMIAEHWNDYFQNVGFYMLDRWIYRPCSKAGRKRIEFRFLSTGMAKACYQKIESGVWEEGIVSVSFGRDVCDADYLGAWAAPKSFF